MMQAATNALGNRGTSDAKERCLVAEEGRPGECGAHGGGSRDAKADVRGGVPSLQHL